MQRLLHSEGYKRRSAKKKVVVQEANRKKRVKWSKEGRGRTADNYWEKVLFSDGSQIMLGTNNEGCPLLWDLALINRAGGLYGRILTEVASTDRTQ